MPNDTLHPFSLPAIGRKKLTEEIEVLFVHILLLAREMGVLKMGTVALDGTNTTWAVLPKSGRKIMHLHKCNITMYAIENAANLSKTAQVVQDPRQCQPTLAAMRPTLAATGVTHAADNGPASLSLAPGTSVRQAARRRFHFGENPRER